jgi:two-component system KDP operon response regulator KdpE
MGKTCILVVDDEPGIVRFVRANLEDNGYRVLAAMDGAEALRKIEMELPDLVILDIMMPKMDGFEVCRRLREWSRIPTIMLSARGDETDKVKCLDLGADDYLTKPFGTRELLARVRAVLRRTEATKTTPTQPIFTSGDLWISFTQRRVTLAGKEVELTPTEYSLLQEFVLNVGKTLTHSYLLNRVWGPEYMDEREYLHVFVRRLRMKLEPDATNHNYIMTVPGVGYRFRDTAQS